MKQKELERQARLIQRLKRKNSRLNAELVVLRVASLLMAAVALVCAGTYFRNQYDYEKTKVELEEARTEIMNLESRNMFATGALYEAEKDLETLTHFADELDGQVATLTQKIEEQQEVLAEYEAREDLVSKYSFAMTRTDGTTTDISLDDIITLEKLVQEEGWGQDMTALVLAIAIHESQGKEKAKNSQSTATGLCQLLRGTGRYTYEVLMGNGSGTYDHSMAYNGTLNLEMAAHYLHYLYEFHGGNGTKVIDNYRGFHEPSYISWLNNRLRHLSISVSTMDI